MFFLDTAVAEPRFVPAAVSLKLSVAVGIGMLVGLEREWSQKDLGVRTFTIASLTGMLSALALPGVTYFAFAGILLILGLVGIRNIRDGRAVEATTFAALILTFVLGVLVGQGHHYTPVAAAIVMTLLLYLKPALIHFSGGLTNAEVRSAVLLGLLGFVIYPALPNHAVDPWGLINPREAWLTVILIAALGFINYVLLKIYNARGLYYSALLGGMVNSTAAIAELAGYLRDPNADPARMGIVIDLLTVVAMFARNLLILALFARRGGPFSLGPAFRYDGCGAARHLAMRKRGQSRIGELKLSSPLVLSKVLKFGVLFLAIAIAGTLGQRFFGGWGFLAVSILGGLVSSASTTGAAATLALHGQVTPESAGLATVLTSLTSALEPALVQHEIRNKQLTRNLSLVSLAIVALGLLTMWLQKMLF